MDVLGGLSYPYTFHFDQFGAFLHILWCLRDMTLGAYNYKLALVSIIFSFSNIKLLKMLATDFYPKVTETL